MCGRYAAFLPPEAIAALFQVRGELPNWPPTWNMAPTRDGPVVRLHPQTGERRLDLLRWGLLPHWAKDPKTTRQPINARAEGLRTSAMFRDAFARRRCLVPADAFYEWTPGEAARPLLAGTPRSTPEADRDAPKADGDAPEADGDAPEADSDAPGMFATMPDMLTGEAGLASEADPGGIASPAHQPGSEHRSAKRPASPPRNQARKQPWAIARADGQAIAFAGLWEGWRGSDGTVIRSYTIVTTEANDTLRPLHARMPVVLEPCDWPVWLGQTDGDPAHLLRPSDAGFRYWPVGPAVNNVRNDDPTLLDEAAGSQAARGAA